MQFVQIPCCHSQLKHFTRSLNLTSLVSHLSSSFTTWLCACCNSGPASNPAWLSTWHPKTIHEFHMFQLWAGFLPTSKCLDERVHPQECKFSRPLDTHLRAYLWDEAVASSRDQCTSNNTAGCAISLFSGHPGSLIDSICHIFIADSHL